MIQISFVNTCDGSNISNVPLYANLAMSEVKGTFPTKSSASNNILMRRDEWQVQLTTKYCCVEVKVLKMQHWKKYLYKEDLPIMTISMK